MIRSLDPRRWLAPTKGPVFVIGTGRSGTHFVGDCLRKFDGLDDAFGGRESPLIFRRIAQRTVAGEGLGGIELGYYRWMAARVAPRTLLDKTHPNIWHVEALIRAFPGARFVGIRRDVAAVVASMIAHHGTSQWVRSRWAHRVPNRFLGITPANAHVYRGGLTDLQRHVFRWCSHMDRLAWIESHFAESVCVLDFRELHRDLPGAMGRIARFLEEPPPQELPAFDPAALDRSDRLSVSQHREVEDALRLWQELR